MPTLIRDRDGDGFSGSRVESFDPEQNMELVGDKPMVGCCLRVGSMTAGTYSDRDWWMTTPIKEILCETDEEIVFLTQNSKYKYIK
jgi:hypothetical protein